MISALQYVLVGIIVSLFYFSFGFTFWPESLNTKMILAIVGVIIAGYYAVKNRPIKISRHLLGAIGFSILFSLVCFIAVDYNYTDDLSYATYFVSFAVWMFSAFMVCALILWVHGKVNIVLIAYYLAAVCVAQCLLALAIDSSLEFQFWVNRYIEQDQAFLMEVDRLYGIGASLDNAGVRFSIVLIMIAGVLCKEEKVQSSPLRVMMMVIAFFTIIVVGNMISRTTLIGTLLAFAFIAMNTSSFRIVIKSDSFRFHFIFWGILLLALSIITYLYQTDEVFHDQIRFAFEGFFNWVEKGEWRTNSTDKLTTTMWVWPKDLETWLIGSGLFDDWVFGTDIGYCRFVLYCGLIGFSIFAIYFIYNALVMVYRFPKYRSMFFLFMLLSFLIWIKVSTDIFLIYAMFYSVDILNGSTKINKENENRLLHSRYV